MVTEAVTRNFIYITNHKFTVEQPRVAQGHCVDAPCDGRAASPRVLPDSTVPPSKEAEKLRKNLALGIFGLLVAFGLVLGAGANFRDYHADRSVHWKIVSDDTELIDLTPVQPYAYINDAGVLVVDISPDNPNWPGYGNGLSPNSEYNFDEVFNVSNDLWEENMTIVVRITSDNSAIQFYGADENIYSTSSGSAIYASDMAENDVCFVVHSGEAVSVGMDFSVGNDAPGTVQSTPIHIQAYRLGTEPADLDGKCGQ